MQHMYIHDRRNQWDVEEIREELVTKMFKLLAEQGRAARVPNSCAYRLQVSEGEGETRVVKCAIGILIPDEEYDSCMEGVLPPEDDEDIQEMIQAGNERQIKVILKAAGIDERDSKFARALQRVHDQTPIGLTGPVFAAYIYGGFLGVWGPTAPVKLENAAKEYFANHIEEGNN